MSKSLPHPPASNSGDNEAFGAILERRLSRRTLACGGLGAALSLMVGGLSGCSSAATRPGASTTPPRRVTLAFPPVEASMTDACVVPEGYVAHLLAPWGTPLNDKAAPWDAGGNNSASDLLNATGMHHDGMHYFPIDGSSSEGLLVVNHEYIDPKALHPAGPTTVNGMRPAEEVRKEINAHGVSVMHIRLQDGRWNVVRNSRYNRRFTSATPMNLAGPLAGSRWTITPFSPQGRQVRGTNNNCGNGTTPWGTYLTAEENWAGVFVNTGSQPAHQQGMGVPAKASRYGWETAAGDASEQQGEFARFNVTPTGADATRDWRNEINGFGYLVEIDPHDPDSIATKRTAMGRFAHEGAAYAPPVAGQPIAFYSGDDAQFEYVYRYVSDAPWDPADARRRDRLAVGAKYLDKGTLFVARFNDDGSGDWLPLTPASPGKNGGRLADRFATLEEILLDTRGAADFVGATPMDRPEWTAVHPSHGDVYLTLTNNTSRNAQSGTNAANPRLDNTNGHIIRWHDTPGSNRFRWDIFVFGAPAGAPPEVNRSGLTALNQLASPDGIAFDDRGILWIQTDNGIDGGRKNEVARATNDQMLAVVPAAQSAAAGTGPAINAANQAQLRRFFVGPNAAEITGFGITPDHTTLFVNVQHPSNWPAYGIDDATAPPAGPVRPRSSTVVIRKADGGPIGV
jgi:secreted PhoX family phosphatase